MEAMSETRNSMAEITAPDDVNAGVGGRQAGLAGLAGGGGYLDNCTPHRPLLRDFEILEILRAVELPSLWLEIAEFMGPRQFVDLWEHLETAGYVAPGEQRVYLPRISKLHRYQRNAYVFGLARGGMTSTEAIAQQANKTLGTNLTKQHVHYILNHGQDSPAED